ncbi:lipoprotein-releasing ABC transporter permease subunit [Desulfomonile tiedjei]|uniref:Lipoprotein releasing system, transmembrane protein, LolC/E family n=1 Tax=Desulfomonile tiedjei (strain ATCC 49306 / DSM 6799 / DCB-1) TaxID=706587 RepID=I4C891_DESTA|nr:lipoprotein-releasing ABC transporter permease subunit [Desulfomonile tiedjei]AFM25782.1 lipoprotein releasing system, transmembrane protein, LolC/E family [Desulfomonile tiedjei DSM 6799]
MSLAFEISVGFRYIKAKRKQAFISVISAFSILGVMLGVMTLIIVLGVMNGFERDLKDKILGTVSHLVVMSHSSRMLTEWGKLMDRIGVFRGVEATTPYIYGQAMLSTRGKVRGVVIRGIDPRTAGSVISLDNYLKEPSVIELNKTPDGTASVLDLDKPSDGTAGIIIGKELATLNSLRLGDIVQLISPQGKRTPIGAIPRVQNFRIMGIFQSGMYEFDSNLVYMQLSEAQKFFELGEGVSGIEVKLRDIYAAPKLAGRIEASLGHPFWTRTWRDMYRNLFSALKLEKIAMFVILTFIVLVAAFNIVISLIMLVMEKSRDIAILKALGATSDSIMRIFVIQGMVVGFVGTLLGAIGGIAGSALIARYPIIELPTEIYTIDRLPVATDITDVVIICVVALTICFIATLYPSFRAARLEPVEALRYE